MGSLVLSSDREGVRVTDARRGSTAPPQSYALTPGETILRLRAGFHTLTAESGAERLQWTVSLQAGQEAIHHFDFQPSTPAVAPPRAAPETRAPNSGNPASDGALDQPSSGSNLPVIGYVTAGVGLLAVAAGVVTGLKVQSEEKSAKKRLSNDPDLCIGIDCRSSADGEFDDARSLATTTNVLLIGGGILTAAGVVLIVLGSDSKDSPDAEAKRRAPTVTLSLAPDYAPGRAALFARGTFRGTDDVSQLSRSLDEPRCNFRRCRGVQRRHRRLQLR
jgi:hypothetical protein